MTQNFDDIFDRGRQQNLGEFFKFNNVGDRIAGTFVDLISGVDGYGNDQFVVVLRRDGENHRVSVRKSHTILVDRLKQVKFGQIIGFSFDEERPNQGRAATKIINLMQDPSMIDEEWTKNKIEEGARIGLTPQQALQPDFGDAPSAPTAAAPAATSEATPVAPAVPEAPAAAAQAPAAENTMTPAIRTLLSNKGLVADDAADDVVAAKVKELTELELTPENGPAIINKIAVLPAS